MPLKMGNIILSFYGSRYITIRKYYVLIFKSKHPSFVRKNIQQSCFKKRPTKYLVRLHKDFVLNLSTKSLLTCILNVKRQKILMNVHIPFHEKLLKQNKGKMERK